MPAKKADFIAKAKELGIDVDEGLSVKELRSRLNPEAIQAVEDAAKARDAARAENTHEFRVMRGFWPDDEKVEKGEIVEMTMEDAIDHVETGILQRVKK